MCCIRNLIKLGKLYLARCQSKCKTNQIVINTLLRTQTRYQLSFDKVILETV